MKLMCFQLGRITAEGVATSVIPTMDKSIYYRETKLLLNAGAASCCFESQYSKTGGGVKESGLFRFWSLGSPS